MMKPRSNPDLFHLKTQTYTCFVFTSVITNALHWAQICSILSEISHTISSISMVWRTQASLCIKVNYQCLGNVSDPFFPWKINKNFAIRKRSQLINRVWCQQAADLRYPLKQGQNLEDLTGLVDTHDFDYQDSQLSRPFSPVPTILDNIIEVWLYCVFWFWEPRWEWPLCPLNDKNASFEGMYSSKWQIVFWSELFSQEFGFIIDILHLYIFIEIKLTVCILFN